MNTMRSLVDALPEKVDVLRAGRIVGGEDKTSNIALTGTSFLSRTTIPDIQPNTKILAVCGIADYYHTDESPSDGMAAPSEDGWFFSDFFLFHHLFMGIATDQEWMLCERPDTLIKKYGEYAHGSPKVEQPRRVVMDKSMLPELNDVQYFERRRLLPEFLRSLARVVAQAESENRHLMVIILSHGRPEDHAIYMAGGGDPESSSAAWLGMQDFKKAVAEGLQGRDQPLSKGLCLITSACYSGGWAINPDLNIINTMAESNATEMTLSWPFSATVNKRICGSPWATGIADVLVAMSVEDYGQIDQEVYHQSPTHAGFVKLIFNQLRSIDSRADSDGNFAQDPRFSSVGDEWELEYGKRTGIPLGYFKSRWELLRPINASQTKPPSPGHGPQTPPKVQTQQKDQAQQKQSQNDPELHQLVPGERLFTYNQILRMTKMQSEFYLRSYPGYPNAAKNNQITGRIISLLQRKERPEIGNLRRTFHMLDYRINVVMRAATEYKNQLGLQIPDCHLVDVSAMSNGQARYKDTWPMVMSYHLFDHPSSLQGAVFVKGEMYLAAGLARSGWDKNTCVRKLDSLVKYRNPKIPKSIGYSVVPNTSRLTYTAETTELKRKESVRNSLRNLATLTSKRIRDLSPIKRRSRRSTIPSEWMHSDNTPVANSSRQS